MPVNKTHKGLKLLDISPHNWPVSVGELTILLSKKVGYCAVVKSVNSVSARVGLLDWHGSEGDLVLPLYDCIPTGKTPLDLVQKYTPTAQEFSSALWRERSFPDFEAPGALRRKPTTKKKITALKGKELVSALLELTPAQKKKVIELLGKKGA